MRSYYGTPNVTYTGIDAFNAEAGRARIYGGMHFTYATVAGEALGKQVAQWVAQHHFGPQ